MKTVMSIGTHPDDIEIGCGGTESLFKIRGYRIVHVVACLGEEGMLRGNKEELKSKRRSEAEASAKILGAEVRFLGLEDGLTAFNKQNKIEVIRLIREIKPEVLFVHAASDRFPDHQVVRNLSLSAVIAAAGPWYSDAGGEPHRVAQIYGYEVWNLINEPQCVVDITETYDLKRKALACHLSQTEGVDYQGAIEGMAAYRGVSSMVAKLAEAFEVTRTEMLP